MAPQRFPAQALARYCSQITTHTTAPLRSSVSRQRWWWEVVRSLHLLRDAQAANRRPNRCTNGSSIRLSQVQWWLWNGWTSNCYKRLYQYLTISDGPEREQENKIAWQLWYFFVFPEKLPLPAQWCVNCLYSASYSCLSIGSTCLGIVFFSQLVRCQNLTWALGTSK